MSGPRQPTGIGSSRFGAMHCPKCKNNMELVEFDGVEIDRCRNCQGIWFDAGESDVLRKREAAAAIDVGDPLGGRKMDEVDRYRCPRCDGGMLRLSDPQQTHIWFEECTSCKGSFFDAGEFKDLSEQTISIIIRRRSTSEKI